MRIGHIVVLALIVGAALPSALGESLPPHLQGRKQAKASPFHT